jgi:hypothetical protein
MKIFQTSYNDLKFRSSFLPPLSYQIPTVLGTMNIYPRLIEGNSFATRTFKCTERGYYSVYIKTQFTPMSGRVSFKLAIKNQTLSVIRFESDFTYATVQYIGTFYVESSLKDYLIITLEEEFLGSEFAAGDIFIVYDENGFR